MDPRKGSFYVMFGFNGFGGAGGMPGMDGRHYIGDGIDLGGLIAPNIETNESDYPHVTEFNEFTTDSCGAGKFRGGCGARYRIRLYDRSPNLVMFGDGKVHPPYGLFGGRPGSCNLAFVNEGKAGERELKAKEAVQLKQGDTYTSYPSGGGGWGDPLERDPDAVRRDARGEIISLASARDVYGVVLEGEGLEVNAGADGRPEGQTTWRKYIMKKIRKIAVLGAGSGGLMCAADMGSQGYEVALFSRQEDKLTELRAKGGVDVLDIQSRPTGVFGKVALATSDIAAALKGAQLVLNPVPYFVCEEYARLAAPHLDEETVVLYLGKGGASLTWAKALRDLAIKRKVYLADCNTLPYGASKKGGAQVRLENRTQNLIVATFPGQDIDQVAEVAETVFPKKNGYTIRRGQNAIDSILVDYNAITHTPPMICNAARIESGDRTFCLFGKKENSPGRGAPDRAHRPGAHGHRREAGPEAVPAGGGDPAW